MCRKIGSFMPAASIHQLVWLRSNNKLCCAITCHELPTSYGAEFELLLKHNRRSRCTSRGSVSEALIHRLELLPKDSKQCNHGAAEELSKLANLDVGELLENNGRSICGMEGGADARRRRGIADPQRPQL